MADVAESAAAEVVRAAEGFVRRAVAGIKKTVDDLVSRVTLLDQRLSSLPVPKDGERGKDAEVDYDRVAGIIRATVGEAIAALPRPEKGDPGKDADPVDLNALAADLSRLVPVPKDGESIHPDTVRVMVAEEVGKAVAALPKAKNGEPGRDAAQCEPLLSIDEARSYPRGTYAAHRGGTIRSFRQTDPINGAGLLAAGWAVMQNGIASETEETLDDGRTDKRLTVYTDGTVLERMIPRAVVIDRGVWREGTKARKGDGFTWGGSFWIAQRDTDAKPDAADGSFRLSVKRGRDGADAKPVIPQPPGLRGK